MAYQYLNLAWEAKLPVAQKLLLVALADMASKDDGSCYPSIRTLAKRCCLSPRAIFRHIAVLEGRAFIYVERRFIGKRYTSNRYTMRESFWKPLQPV